MEMASVELRFLSGKIVIYQATPMKRYIVFMASEFFATFAFTFIGCMADSVRMSPAEVAFAFGLGVTVAAQSFGHLSGSYLNPAVSLAAFLMGRVALVNLPLYIAFECLGALAAHGVVLLVLPASIKAEYRQQRGVGPCTPFKHPDMETWQVLVLEFTLTFLLILMCSSIWDWRNRMKADSTPLKFGFVIGVLILAGGRVGGANMNPARAFAPCWNNNDFRIFRFSHVLQVYWMGPLVASVCSAMFYKVVFEIPEPRPDAPR